MKNHTIEIKNDAYDAWLEVEIIDVLHNDFEIKYVSNNKYTLFYLWLEKIKTLKYKPKHLPNDSNYFEINQTVRVFNKINENNLKGFVLGVIEDKKGDFYLTNLSNNKGSLNNECDNKKIFHKSEIRMAEE